MQRYRGLRTSFAGTAIRAKTFDATPKGAVDPRQGIFGPGPETQKARTWRASFAGYLIPLFELSALELRDCPKHSERLCPF